MGLRESHVAAAIRREGGYNVAKALGLLTQWKPSPQHADATFERAMQTTTGKISREKALSLPKSDGQLQSFAQQHGLSLARPGEEYFEYRNRLNAELKRLRTG